jgi:hypothetical protein
VFSTQSVPKCYKQDKLVKRVMRQSVGELDNEAKRRRMSATGNRSKQWLVKTVTEREDTLGPIVISEVCKTIRV